MLTAEGQDVIKTTGKIMFVIYYVSNCVKMKGVKDVRYVIHAAHWV
jgi:hypothetical protein